MGVSDVNAPGVRFTYTDKPGESTISTPEGARQTIEELKKKGMHFYAIARGTDLEIRVSKWAPILFIDMLSRNYVKGEKVHFSTSHIKTWLNYASTKPDKIQKEARAYNEAQATKLFAKYPAEESEILNYFNTPMTPGVKAAFMLKLDYQKFLQFPDYVGIFDPEKEQIRKILVSSPDSRERLVEIMNEGKDDYAKGRRLVNIAEALGTTGDILRAEIIAARKAEKLKEKSAQQA